jgi:hypothetical protein
VRLGPDDHLLVIRLHHTVFDDWSVDVFRRELSALYAAAVAGVPSPLLELPVTFVEYCRRQRERMAGDIGAAQRSWWARELDGAPLAVQVPLAGDGARSGPEPGEPLRMDLPSSLAGELRAVAPRLRATPFMTVLAAFSVLLARVTGQDDLVIATVVAHRDRSDLEPMIGCFTKKVPLRLRLDGDPTFRELVARTRTSLLGALSHQDVAFEAAVQEGLGRAAADHGVVPQVTVVFQGETPQQVKLTMPGLVTSRFEAGTAARGERHFSTGPNQDKAGQDEPAGEAGPEWGDGIYLGTFLILSLLETPDGMALVARGVFSRPAARRLLAELVALLAEVAAEPARSISQLAAVALPGVPDDVVEVRGFRASRSRIEAALARSPGVADVALAVRDGADGQPRLVAYVVPDGDGPTLAELRHALWSRLPGALWPADAVTVDRLHRLPDGRLDPEALPAPTRSRPGEPDPVAAALAAMWSKVRGQPVRPDTIYWQDFSFLQALDEARRTGLPIGDDQVVRCRTPETLAAAIASAAASPGS